MSTHLNKQVNLLDDLNLDTVHGALDELFMLARRYKESSKFRELLDFVATFKRYSAFNAMLVHIQMPGAKYVLPAKRWLKEYKRKPVLDAQPLVMLKPKGPVMFGYDVSQTNGKPLPYGFDNPFKPDGRIDPREYNLTISNAQRDGVQVRERSLGSTLGGYVRNARASQHQFGVLVDAGAKRIGLDSGDLPVFAEITLNANLTNETNYATLTHELGHLYCGHVGTPNFKLWPDRSYIDKNTAEFEAESVSYIVCLRAGLATPAAAYLHS